MKPAKKHFAGISKSGRLRTLCSANHGNNHASKVHFVFDLRYVTCKACNAKLKRKQNCAGQARDADAKTEG